MVIEIVNLVERLTISFLLPKVELTICQTYNHYIGTIMLPKVMVTWFARLLLLVIIIRLSLFGISCWNNTTQ